MWSVSAGSGVPVVMVHGAFSDYRYWEPQLESFGEAHHAFSLSLRGYHPENVLGAALFSAEEHVHEVGAFLSTIDGPAHLIGHSRGGRIALQVAAEYSDLVRSLVLIEPGGIADPDFYPSDNLAKAGAPGLDVRPHVQALIALGDIEAGLKIYVDSGHGEGAWDRSPELFRRVARSNASTIGVMIHDRTVPLSQKVACSVKIPTLLLEGGRSPPIFSKTIHVLEKCLPRSLRVLIADGDHFLTLNAIREVNQAVLKFIE